MRCLLALCQTATLRLECILQMCRTLFFLIHCLILKLAVAALLCKCLFFVCAVGIFFFLTQLSFLPSRRYLADRRLDMLPAVLSEQVCSLRERQDRFAFSVFWEFDKTSKEIIRTWFARVVIRSTAELHYKAAQDIFDNNASNADRARLATDYEGVRGDIITLVELARVLRARRLARGAIELESQQLKFELNASKEPTKIIPKEEYEVNRAVAEWMILANEAVGKRIWQT